MQTTGELIIFYKQQLELARKILLITKVIADRLHDDRIDCVVKKINKRAELINRLKSFERLVTEQGHIRRQSSPGVIIPEEKILLAFKLEIKKIFEEALDIDRETKAQILQEKEKVARELQILSSDHQLNNRYFPERESAPKFFSVSL